MRNSFILIIALLLISCTEVPNVPVNPSVDPSNAVDGINQFAFKIYSELEGDNVFISPYSISTALAMTYEGARGETASEIQSVFHFPQNSDVRRNSFARIYNLINKEDKQYELHTANALWAQQDYRFLNQYFETIGKYYGGKVTNLDFTTQTERSRQTINSWVEDQTNNKIKDLIPAGVLTPLTHLVLTNAIYFKGTWVKQFNNEYTIDEEFRVNPSKTVKVPMMRLTDAKFNYAETEELQILELPYEGDGLSMLILLPKNELQPIELTLDKFNEWKRITREQRVDVFIPRFKFETKYFLTDTLKEMGMPTAFSSRADLSGMDGTKNLFISDVIHQAFVEVNEEGTEAAAATAVAVDLTSVGPITPVFRADHPFIFVIQEKGTGLILFLGKVSDPS